jgi:hypothetical protein
MKYFFALALFLISLGLSPAGESSVVYAYQVSDGLGSGEPKIERIYCHDYYSHSGIPHFRLISTANIPPTNSPLPIEDHNIVSASGITIGNTTEEPWIVTIDASQARIPKRFGIPLPVLINLASEAVSKTAIEWNLKDFKIVVKFPQKNEKEAEQGAAANP